MPCLRFLRKFSRSPFSMNSIRTRMGWDMVTTPMSFTTCSVLKKKKTNKEQMTSLYLHPSMVEASRRNSLRSLSPASLCKNFTAHWVTESSWLVGNVLVNINFKHQVSTPVWNLWGFPCRLFQNIRFPILPQWPHPRVWFPIYPPLPSSPLLPFAVFFALQE